MTHTATTRNRRSPRACTAGVEARLVPTPQHSSLCRGLSTLGSRVLRPQHVGVACAEASARWGHCEPSLEFRAILAASNQEADGARTRRRRRVAAARLAADRRSAGHLVLAALRADARRDARERFSDAVRACRDNCAVDAAERPTLFSARRVARDRFADECLRPPRPSRNARSAARRVRADVVPFRGGGRSTPDRRALESPMAMACLVERAPCLPSRRCSISSRTNSPACVDGARPARFA